MSSLHPSSQTSPESNPSNANPSSSDSSSPLFNALSSLMKACMSNHDPSHNPSHVYRVVALARRILASEQHKQHEKRHDPQQTGITYDAEIIDLAALLHDLTDRKYLSTVTRTLSLLPSSNITDTDKDASNLVKSILRSHGADPTLADSVQTIVSHVSYSTEKQDPSKIQNLIKEGYPELAIVQDADRLDALGAVGIGRCFTYLGASFERSNLATGLAPTTGDVEWELSNSIEHFEDKLVKLEGMMKTETGREMARERTARLRLFKEWWEEELEMAV